MGPKNAIDMMIEGWASESAPPVKSEPIAFVEAAKAIAQALRENTGRRKNVKHWVVVARRVLGVSRLSTQKYEAVLDAGYAAGYFTLDSETLSYPILLPVAKVEEEDVEVAKVEEEEDVEVAKVEEDYTSPPLPHIPSAPPLDLGTWAPMKRLACGHWDIQTVPVDATAVVDHLSRIKVPSKSVRVESPGAPHCPACVLGVPGSYQDQKGEYRKPVPPALRRTVEKSASSYPGFPGLCADPESGLYIGGLGNHCTRYYQGKERCVVHAARRKEAG